jgi:uncharacterized protein
MTSTDETALLERMRAIGGPLAVAYSGGADSALVLAAGVRALGARRVLAVTAVSESLAPEELAPARALAASLGVVHLTPRTEELSHPGYRANGPDRCYFCKSEVLDTIAALGRARGFPELATGTNADDAVDPFRPGIRAGQERGVHTPLRDAGLSKRQVREISRRWSLPTWDKPATPCLASRIRHGVEVTGHRLARVARAEVALRAVLDAAGVRTTDLRVRDLGGAVRVEVDADLVGTATALPGVLDAVRDAGFAEADVRVRAFRSGSLHQERTPGPTGSAHS